MLLVFLFSHAIVSIFELAQTRHRILANGPGIPASGTHGLLDITVTALSMKSARRVTRSSNFCLVFRVSWPSRYFGHLDISSKGQTFRSPLEPIVCTSNVVDCSECLAAGERQRNPGRKQRRHQSPALYSPRAEFALLTGCAFISHHEVRPRL